MCNEGFVPKNKNDDLQKKIREEQWVKNDDDVHR